MPEVFISYSRADQGFARDINEGLHRAQREPWVDWRSIPDSAYWRAEIFAAIEDADNFLFIISPDSLRSEMCRLEVAHASALNKRIITVLYRLVDSNALTPALREIQWILYPELGLQLTLNRIIDAVGTDFAWNRKHTRLATRAREWETADYDDSYLLRGLDLREATRWLEGADSLKRQKPLLLHEQYIRASQEYEAIDAAQRATRQLKRVSSALELEVLTDVPHYTEPYAADSPYEYWLVWRKALAGGLFLALTVVITFRIYSAAFPPLIEGLACGTLFAASFIIMQIFGLILAIKQPKFTTAQFEQLLRSERGLSGYARTINFVARICNTQFAATVGNLVTVSFGAILFEKVWLLVFSDSFLTSEDATRVYEQLDPHSLAYLCSALVTGLMMWVAGLLGGWMDRIVLRYRVPQSILQTRVYSRLGAKSIHRVTLNGLGVSIALGYLMGFAHSIGLNLGFTLYPRQVTVSTGLLALSAGHFGARSLERNWFLYASAGLFVVFVLNMVGSIVPAVVSAFGATGISKKSRRNFYRSLARYMTTSAYRFIVPSFGLADARSNRAIMDGTVDRNE